MSRGDRSRGGPEEAPPDPAAHPPPPHGPYGLLGQGWRQTLRPDPGPLRVAREGGKPQTQPRWVSRVQGSPGRDGARRGAFKGD